MTLPFNNNNPKTETRALAVEYQTTDLPLSAFLIVRGHRLLEIRSRGVQGVFVFNNSEELAKDILIWGTNQPVHIAPRVFFNQVRDLKGMVGVNRK